jgi:hypothetical protein
MFPRTGWPSIYTALVLRASQKKRLSKRHKIHLKVSILPVLDD